MGEYAKYGGERVKIGTCEDMYYLRADQRHRVIALAGNVDPDDREDQKTIRFRFPFPDEDRVAPGGFEDHDRGIGLTIKTLPEFRHYPVQFRASAGYLVSLPCPEDEEGPSSDHGLTFHRDGFSGNVRVMQQAFRSGVLALVCACGGCGAKFSLHTLEQAQPILDELRAKAERELRAKAERERATSLQFGYAAGSADWWDKVVERAEAGYR